MTAVHVASQLPHGLGTQALNAARNTFMDGLHAGSYVAAAAAAVAALVVLVFLPKHDA